MNHDDTMQLHDLKEAWVMLDQRLGSGLERVEAMASALAEDRTGTLVRRVIWTPAMELLTTAVVALFLVIGLLHGGSAVFVSCSLAALLFLVALMVSEAWQIKTLAAVDAAAPVVATQRSLGRVSAVRIFVTKWTLLLSPALWAPGLVVLVELPMRLLITDLEGTVFTAGFVWLNLLIGIVLTIILHWLSRRLAGRMQGTRFLRNLLDDFAGRRLVAARAFLARLDGFERD